jgi:hypothetical protein
MRTFRPSAGALLLLCVVTTAPVTDAAAQSQDRSDSAAANPLAAQPLERFSATIGRPLFSSSRRPPAPPPPPVVQAEPPPAPTPPPNVVLVGIVMDGDSARAIMRSGGENKTIRAQIGDDVGGWKVSQIDGRKVVLSLDDRFATFMLFNRDGNARALANGENAQGASGAKKPTQQSELKQNSAPANEDSNHSRKRRRARQ